MSTKKGSNIILASQSPRRRELLKDLKLNFKVVPSNYEEELHNLPPKKFVITNAFKKAAEVANRYPKDIVIGVDTIGYYKGKILEKASSHKEAAGMLRLLSGTTHWVYSGIAIIQGEKVVKEVIGTKVTFARLTSADISRYLESGEGKDKAASFAIQGLGALFIKKIDGDYFNVVGLPIFTLGKMLKKFGIDLIKNYNAQLADSAK